MPKTFRSARFWLGAFLIWFGVLWLFSSNAQSVEKLPPIPFFDKIAHFGYYFGGGGLFSAFLFCRNPRSPHWRHIIFLTVLVIGLVGIIDEFHQTFTPGRSGNDPFDWLADVLGGLAGALVFKRVHRAIA